VCLNDKTKKAFSRLCPPDRREPVDVIELFVVKTSGADLKCRDHLCKLNHDYVGQILDITENGHDHLSRPKVRLTVSCIREVSVNESDQLFPVFCDQEKALHADEPKAAEDAAGEQRIKDYLTRISTGGSRCTPEEQARASRILKVLNKKVQKCMSPSDEQYLKEIRGAVLADVSHAPKPSPAPAPNVKDAAAPVGIILDPGDTSALKHFAGSEAACLIQMASEATDIFRLFQSLGIEKMPPDEQKTWIKELMTKNSGETEPALSKLVPQKEDRAILSKFAVGEKLGGAAVRGGGAAAVHDSPKAGVSPLAPPSDSTAAPVPAPAQVAPRSLAPASAPVSDPSPCTTFVPFEPLADSPAPAQVPGDRKNDAVVALLQQLDMSHLVPKFK
jgi:hypothetical protein